jgi:hypothetical protein
VRTKLIAVCAVLLALAPAAKAQSPELSVTSRLDDRRYVASGSWAYVVGTEAGNFPAMGFHTRGEMGGVWSPPLKLLDGIWFAVDGRWLNDAARFTSGYGYTRMDFPERSGLRISRTDFVPDGDRTVVMKLRLRSTGAARTVNLAVDAHSELMSAYPWGETTPSQLTFNGQDQAAYAGRALNFAEPGKPWRAAVTSRPAPDSGETGPGFRGPVTTPVICPPSGEGQPEAPDRCDDSAYGKGAGGRLRYRLVERRGERPALRRGRPGRRQSGAPRQDRPSQAPGRPHAPVAARRPVAGAGHRLEQAEPGRLGAGGREPAGAGGA